MKDQAAGLRRLARASRDRDRDRTDESAHGNAAASHSGGANEPSIVTDATDAATAIAGATATAVAETLPHSTPTGVVSFRPRQTSREVSPRDGADESPKPVRLAHAIAVTSGKGGVGKSNLALNLAVTLAKTNRRVCVLDADLGMANIDVLCNVQPRVTLQHVLAGRCHLRDAMILAPGGFSLIPGASGVSSLADIGGRHRSILLRQLAALERAADVIIIDCAAGISTNVLAFAHAAHLTLVTTTPEPPAVTDAYGMVKSLLRHDMHSDLKLVVNMTEHPREGAAVHGRMNRVVKSFLGRTIDYAGSIPADGAVPYAVRRRLPFTLMAPEAAAAQAVNDIAARLIGQSSIDANGQGCPGSQRSGGFFNRLSSFLGRSK